MFTSASWKRIIGDGAYLVEATQYKNLYLLYLSTGNTLVFDFINGFFWELDYEIRCGYYDKLEQKLYYTIDGVPDTRLLVFNNADNAYIYNVKTYSYKTGKIMLNTPVNFKYVRVFADSYVGSITINAYDSGILKFSRDISSDDIVKIPSIRFNEAEIEIVSNVVINFINISTTLEEMLGA